MPTSPRPQAKATPAFHVRGLTKIYETDGISVQALRGVDLDIATGELLVLVGPSGSGKSTLLNILGGLDQPTSGDVFFNEAALTRMSAAELTTYRRRHVGFVFQFYNLIPSLTAVENVQLVTEIATDPMPATEALAMVDLTDRIDHFPSQLSGGEQQRVAIARAIAKRPEVLLCDEPTGALDSHTGIMVLEAIERVNSELGTTTALITHNAAIGVMADATVRFLDGQIASIERNQTRQLASSISW